MAFTASDLTACETAIRTLATGGANQVQIGEKMYRRENLKALMDYYSWLKAQVQGTADDGLLRVSFKGKNEL